MLAVVDRHTRQEQDGLTNSISDTAIESRSKPRIIFPTPFTQADKLPGKLNHTGLLPHSSFSSPALLGKTSLDYPPPSQSDQGDGEIDPTAATQSYGRDNSDVNRRLPKSVGERFYQARRSHDFPRETQSDHGQLEVSDFIPPPTSVSLLHGSAPPKLNSHLHSSDDAAQHTDSHVPVEAGMFEHLSDGRSSVVSAADTSRSQDQQQYPHHPHFHNHHHHYGLDQMAQEQYGMEYQGFSAALDRDFPFGKVLYLI